MEQWFSYGQLCVGIQDSPINGNLEHPHATLVLPFANLIDHVKQYQDNAKLDAYRFNECQSVIDRIIDAAQAFDSLSYTEEPQVKDDTVNIYVTPKRLCGVPEPTDLADVTPDLTFGEQAVNLKFNPSGDPEVYKCKKYFASLIDQMHELRETTDDTETKRRASIAITEMEGAQMWAVKAITTPPAGHVIKLDPNDPKALETVEKLKAEHSDLSSEDKFGQWVIAEADPAIFEAVQELANEDKHKGLSNAAWERYTSIMSSTCPNVAKHQVPNNVFLTSVMQKLNVAGVKAKVVTDILNEIGYAFVYLGYKDALGDQALTKAFKQTLATYTHNVQKPQVSVAEPDADFKAVKGFVNDMKSLHEQYPESFLPSGLVDVADLAFGATPLGFKEVVKSVEAREGYGEPLAGGGQFFTYGDRKVGIDSLQYPDEIYYQLKPLAIHIDNLLTLKQDRQLTDKEADAFDKCIHSVVKFARQIKSKK